MVQFGAFSDRAMEICKKCLCGVQSLDKHSPAGPENSENSPAGPEKCRIPPTGPENPKNQPRMELKSSPNCPAGPENVPRRSASQSSATVFGSYIFFAPPWAGMGHNFFSRALLRVFGSYFFFACTAPSFWVIIFFRVSMPKFAEI